MGTATGTRVAVGGTGSDVAVCVGLRVGGTGVHVAVGCGVGVEGTGVSVAGASVAVGGT